MKYFSYFTVIFLLLSFLLIFLSPNSFTYPSYGEDCKGHHGITYISLPYDKDAEIILDGEKTEDFWNDSDNKGVSIKIPTVSAIGSGFGIANTTVNMTFIRNDYELLILCEWLDNTTKPIGDIYDGLYICWNINVPEFTAYFSGGMWTYPMGGGNIDSWGWSINSSSTYENGSSYECEDNCIRNYGWHDGYDHQDVFIGFSYIINQSYTLEIKRNLLTDEENYDVQFSEKKIYEFTIGIIDDTSLGGHAISWVYALDLRDSDSNNDGSDKNSAINPKLNFGFLLIIIITLIISLITLALFYWKKRVK